MFVMEINVEDVSACFRYIKRGSNWFKGGEGEEGDLFTTGVNDSAPCRE